VAASGDVLLAAQTMPAELPADWNAADPSPSSSDEHAAAPVITADPEVPGILSASSLDTNDDTGTSFDSSATADVFWFKFEDSETLAPISDRAESMDDQGLALIDLASIDGNSSGELALTAKLASLFHDSAASDASGLSNSGGGYIAASSGAEPGNNLLPTVVAGADGHGIITAPIVADPPGSSSGPIPNWIIEGSGGGGTSGGSGGTSSSSLLSNSSTGLIININWDSSVANAPAAFKTDVMQVVNYYESHFSNPITITIDVGYGEVGGYSLGSGALGESITYFDQVSYAQLQSALVENLNANGNSAAAATLPATSPVSGQWWVSTAEAEALGITSASNNPDGYVGFSSAANIFAYDDSNGVPSGQYDFTAVVAHEISEVMGRQMFDGTNAFGTGASYDPLDLFHYSAPGLRDFTGYTGYMPRPTAARPAWPRSMRFKAVIWPTGRRVPATMRSTHSQSRVWSTR